MLSAAKGAADSMGADLKIGSLYSSDTFYDDTHKATDWEKAGCLAVEMEAAALYMTALRLKRRALAVCTISDLAYPPFTGLDAKDREQSFTQMMELALRTAKELEELPLLTSEE